MSILKDHEIKSWREKGYVVVNNIIDNKLLNKSISHITELYDNNSLKCRDFGSDGVLEFPTGSIVDKISINENLINCVQQLLNTNNIFLIQCDTWGKKGNNDLSELSNNDQRMHMDYGNNMFLHPSNWHEPEAVAAIIYLSDVNDTSGGTAIVPRDGDNDSLYQFPYINMPGINEHKYINNKYLAEQYFKESRPDIYDFRNKLYEREIKLSPNFGDILFYRLDTWHRGTPVKNGKIRYVMNLLWKKKECFWINNWNPGWTKSMYHGHIEKLFIEMTPLQRSIIGIPLPGDKYWDKEKIELLKFRYPQIDTEPYIFGIK